MIKLLSKTYVTATIAVFSFFTPRFVLADGVTDGLSSIRGNFGVTRYGDGTAMGFLQTIINILLYFSVGIAVLFVVIGGYQYITSGGNQEQADKGKKTLINAVIGIVVITLAFVVINAVAATVRSPLGGSTGGGYINN